MWNTEEDVEHREDVKHRGRCETQRKMWNTGRGGTQRKMWNIKEDVELRRSFEREGWKAVCNLGRDIAI